MGGPQGVPALGEGEPDVLADCRVLGADQRGVRVVVELPVLRAPGQHHREAGDQHGADGVAQARGPRADRPEGGGGPVVGRHQPSRLAPVGEEFDVRFRRGTSRPRAPPAEPDLTTTSPDGASGRQPILLRRPAPATYPRSRTASGRSAQRRPTTWSMQAVSALTSSGSTAGNMPTRSWLRPSLR